MENVGYVTLSRQMALFRQMDVIANNIANANTGGYKSQSVLFSEHMAGKSGELQVSFVKDAATRLDMGQGELKPTHRPLDAAIDGDGFFVIQTPLGARYTRVGSFQINHEGDLVNSQGYKVQGQGGTTITFAPEDRDVTFGENGVIKVTVLGGIIEDRGFLQVVKFDDMQKLQKQANSSYAAADGQAPIEAMAKEDFRVIQGMLEGSNVNSTKELTDMIKVSRAVSSTGNFMKELHEMQRKAISTISRQN